MRFGVAKPINVLRAPARPDKAAENIAKAWKLRAGTNSGPHRVSNPGEAPATEERGNDQRDRSSVG